MARRKSQGFSWQLIGIVAVVAVFLVGGIIWLASGGGRQELVPPLVVMMDEGLDLEAGVSDEGYPTLGDPDAPVTFYEFADFQCPHCKDHHDLYAKALSRDYLATGKARMAWVTFAFMGDESTNAAKAGFCALDQDPEAFWTLHDWMFENQADVANTGAFSAERLAQMADRVGLDVEAFETCLADPATLQRVEDGKAFAVESGVESTPSFLVGETLVAGTGEANLATLRQALDQAAGGE